MRHFEIKIAELHRETVVKFYLLIPLIDYFRRIQWKHQRTARLAQLLRSLILRILICSNEEG